MKLLFSIGIPIILEGKIYADYRNKQNRRETIEGVTVFHVPIQFQGGKILYIGY